MSQKNSALKKSLSVFLTVIMIFTTLSVGIIIPETKIKSDAATVGATYDVGSISAINSAIAAANTAGSNVITTIKLSSDISVGETAALTAITGNVLFDFNGKSLTFSYSGRVGATADSYEYQLPSELQTGSMRAGEDYVDYGMFNISDGGKMQIINTSSVDVSMECYTYTDRNISKNAFDYGRHNMQATSSLINSSGELIIGDKNNAGYNNFTLQSRAVVYASSGSLDMHPMSSSTNVYTATVNGASAVFKMYGGTVNADTTSQGKRDANYNSRCYAVNIQNAYSAEIYGGSININGSDSTGMRNTDTTTPSGGTGIFAAIRTNCSNTYIFNCSSSVVEDLAKDTKNISMYTANVYIPDDTKVPYIYGGNFSNASTRSNNNNGNIYLYNFYGAYKIAIDGALCPSGEYGVNNPSSALTGTRDSTSLLSFTKLYLSDTYAENGVYPWGYNTFREYVAARSFDAHVSSSSTHHNDGASQTLTTDYKYLRNGYTQTGWYGSYDVANEQGTSGVSASGTLFLYPKWTLNVYDITYDLNDTTGNNTATNPTGAPTTYSITSTSTLPLPTRPGYTFDGWTVTAKSYPTAQAYLEEDGDTTDNISHSTDTNDLLWLVGTTYSAGRSLNGKVGNVWLKANWTADKYKAKFDWDNIAEGESGTATVTESPEYTVNSSFTFPTGCTKKYYTFNDQWKVSVAAGSFTANSAYDAGSTSPNAAYGNVTFKAQYTPIPYTITFDTDGGVLIDSITYNYESTETLPATTRLGYTFAGWQPTEVSSGGGWDSAVSYPAGTSLNHKHDNVTLKAKWESVTSTVTLSLESDEYIDGNTALSYAFSTPLMLNNPTKTGYEFKGWKISSVPTYTNEANANRWELGHEYLLGSETNVILPSSKLGDVTLKPIWEAISYTVTFNANGGAACEPKTYKITDSFNLATTARNGYTFSHWAVTSHDEVYNWTASAYAGAQAVSGMYGDVTLSANWVQKEYDVTLDVNGGNALANSSLIYKTESATALPTPIRTGYTFKGWKVTSVGASSDWTEYTGRPADDIYTDALPYGHYGDITLTAQWEHTNYTITLVTSGTNAGDRTYHIDDAAFTLGSSAISGYTFKKWVVNASVGNWEKDTEYSATSEISGKYGNVTLSAVFEPISYTVTYKNENGEQWGSVDSYTIEDTITLRGYTVDGYTFGGWRVASVDAGGGWNTDSVMAAGELSANMYYGNVTLEPVLTPVNYTITFIPNGGTAYPSKTYNIETDDYTLPTSTKTGYDFTGWLVSAVGGNWIDGVVYPSGTAVEGKYGNVTLTAQWTPKKYSITYIVGNTTLYPDGIVKQGTYGQTAPDLTDEEKAKPSDAQFDYTFSHWNPSLNTVTGETVYTAVYEETLRSYGVTWMIPSDIGGTLGGYTATVTPDVDYGAVPVYNNGINPTLASADPTEYSWRFAGWALTENGTALGSIPTVTGDATYYAVFTKVLAPVEVNWVINGITNTELWGIGETPVWEHDIPTKPDENGYKYIFSGWDPTPVPVQTGNTYTYTAVFASELQTYSYVFRLNGGEMTEATSGTYKMGDAVNFPVPTRTGYSFDGWKLDAAVGTWQANTVVNGGEYVTNTLWGNVSFTAQWVPVTYRITYSKSTPDDTVPGTQEYTVESTDALGFASREGYELTGWVVSVATGNWVQGERLSSEYTLLNNYGDVTLSPVWQVKTYKIYWISGDVTQESEVEYGSAILSFMPSSRMGYTADWDSEVPATMPSHDLTFTAVYTPVEYYVRVNVNGGSETASFYYTIDGDNVLPTPTRDGADFVGWKVTVASGNWSKNTVLPGGTSLNGKYGNVTLTAQWSMYTCTVIWQAGDITKTTVWYYGATPSFDGVPYKSPDDHNSYVFTGWDKEIVPVTEDEVTYTALFEATERMYTVIWNIDGVAYRQEYSYGDMPVYDGPEPTRLSTTEYDFTFSGWTPEVTEVTRDVTYVAQFDVFTKILGLSLDVSSAFLELDGIESEKTLSAAIYPTNATVRDIRWTSLDPEVVSVDANGCLSAVSAGVSVIKVSSVDGRFNSYCVVTVNPRHTKTVLVTANGVSTTQLPGTIIKLTATIQPDNATDPGIEWISSDPTVATVDNGVVLFIRPGTATITAVASDKYSMGSIVVKTTDDEQEVEEQKKVYRVDFADVGTGFIFEDCDRTFNQGYRYVTEGESIRFKLSTVGLYVTANGSLIDPDKDGWYTISDIRKNYAVMTVILPVGVPDEEPVIPGINDDSKDLTFFQRLQQFFRRIVEFFRGLFGKQ